MSRLGEGRPELELKAANRYFYIACGKFTAHTRRRLYLPVAPPSLNYYRMSARYFGAPAAALALALFTATAANFKGDGAGSALLPTQSQNRTLTFADRVAYQSAIENVYWQHRIWPKERRDSKPSLDAVLSPAQIEKKVKDYLHNCQILRDNEHQITA